MHPIRICEIVLMSSHVHILFDADSVQQIADYMEYAGSNLAREVNRLTGWSGPVFDRRYTMIPVSNEEAAQVEALKYVIGHGVKEGLVEHVDQWPGIHSAQARLRGEPLTGHWFSHTKEYAARRRGKDFDPLEYATEETVELSPIPCWEHLPTEGYRERIHGLVEEVEEEAVADRERTGLPARGPEAIQSQDPQHRPEKLAKSPAPFVHAASKAARLALYQSYSWFVGEFRKAAEKLRRGERRRQLPARVLPTIPAFRAWVETGRRPRPDVRCWQSGPNVWTEGISVPEGRPDLCWERSVGSERRQIEARTRRNGERGQIGRSDGPGATPRSEESTTLSRESLGTYSVALYQSYSWFVGEFRKAAEKLRRGDRDVSFPPGCFPPGLPFVPG